MIKELIYGHFDNERLIKESKEIDPNKPFNMAPSYLTDCKRKIYYKKTNEPASNPIDTHAYIKFALGDATHEKIQSILKQIGIYKDGEDWKEINKFGLDWIYRYDGKLKINETDYIIEIKSSYGNGIEYIQKEGAKPEHILQLYVYMLFEHIKHGMLLYIGRDNGWILEYNFSMEDLDKMYEDKLLDLIIDLKDLKEKIKASQLPIRDFQIVMKKYNGEISEDFTKDKVKYKSDWHCSYCSWKDLCWKEEIKTFKESDEQFFIKEK